jgi:mRNA interferase MazF
VEISENSPVYGVVLADQIKNLDWRKRNAAYIASAEDELVQEVVEKAFALLSPEEDEG